MRTLRGLTAIITAVCLTSVVAMGFEPMSATIRVSNDSLYDYVVIGEHPQASDGFDNAYDTISPGNLNADMGQPFISVIIHQPEWKPVMQELRGDIRRPAKRQEWRLTISSSLPKGTPLNLALQVDESRLPQSMMLTLKDSTSKKETDLRAGNCTLSAPGPGTASKLRIIAEQP